MLLELTEKQTGYKHQSDDPSLTNFLLYYFKIKINIYLILQKLLLYTNIKINFDFNKKKL